MVRTSTYLLNGIDAICSMSCVHRFGSLGPVTLHFCGFVWSLLGTIFLAFSQSIYGWISEWNPSVPDHYMHSIKQQTRPKYINITNVNCVYISWCELCNWGDYAINGQGAELYANCEVCALYTDTSLWWRLKSPALRLFTQPFIQPQMTENIKAPRHWPRAGNSPVSDEFPTQRANFHLMTSYRVSRYLWCQFICIETHVAGG